MSLGGADFASADSEVNALGVSLCGVSDKQSLFAAFESRLFSVPLVYQFSSLLSWRPPFAECPLNDGCNEPWSHRSRLQSRSPTRGGCCRQIVHRFQPSSAPWSRSAESDNAVGSSPGPKTLSTSLKPTDNVAMLYKLFRQNSACLLLSRRWCSMQIRDT